jgi:hypothetical protein
MTAARIARRKAVRLKRPSSAGKDPARRVAPYPSLTEWATHQLDAVSARPATPLGFPDRGPAYFGPPDPATPTIPAAAKSP